MKAAPIALIDLLATNQFVMYDRYTFTLIDGTVVVFTTDDPDKLAPFAVPSSTYVLDTFTGTAGETLATHVGEIGATWTAGLGGYPGLLTDQELNGSGSLSPVSSRTGRYGASGMPANDLSDYFQELEFTFPAGFNTYAELECASFDPSVHGFQFYAISTGPSLLFGMSATSSTGASFGNFPTWGPHDGLAHILRAEVTNGRKTVRLFVDGAFYFGTTFVDPLPMAITQTGLYISPVTSPAVQIHRIEGSAL